MLSFSIKVMTEKQIVCKLSLMLTNDRHDTNSVLLPTASLSTFSTTYILLCQILILLL